MFHRPITLAMVLLLMGATAANAQIDADLTSAFQNRSTALYTALQTGDDAALDTLVAPDFESTLAYTDGVIIHFPRHTWLWRATQDSALEPHTILARQQGDIVVVTSRFGQELTPRFIVTDNWSRRGDSWQLLWRNQTVFEESGI